MTESTTYFYIGTPYSAAKFARRHDLSQHKVRVVKDRVDVMGGPADSLVILGPSWAGDPAELLNILERIHLNKWQVAREEVLEQRRRQTLYPEAPHYVYLCWLRDEGCMPYYMPLATDIVFLYSDRELFAPLPENYGDSVKLVAIPTDKLTTTVDSVRAFVNRGQNKLLFRGSRVKSDVQFSLVNWQIADILVKFGGILLTEPDIDQELLRLALKWMDQTCWHGGNLRSVIRDMELDGYSFQWTTRAVEGANDEQALGILNRVKELPEVVGRETLTVLQRWRGAPE